MKLCRLLANGLASALFFAWVDAAKEGETIGPPEGNVTAELVNLNGSGCPPGSALVAISPDNTAFTVTYSSYLASAGYGSGPFDWRKNCQLAVQVLVPHGFTYAVVQADYRGFASLPEGAKASQLASYYFQGMPQTVRSNHRFQGPYEDNWQVTDNTDIAAIVYHPCGAQRNLNVNTELRVYKGNSNAQDTSFITMDSTDVSFSTIYHFQWKKCEEDDDDQE